MKGVSDPFYIRDFLHSHPDHALEEMNPVFQNIFSASDIRAAGELQVERSWQIESNGIVLCLLNPFAQAHSVSFYETWAKYDREYHTALTQESAFRALIKCVKDSGFALYRSTDLVSFSLID